MYGLSQNKILDTILPYCKGKKVLDVGCVGTYPETSKFRHKHIKEVSNECIGLDINKEGIQRLSEEGYNVKYANVEKMDLGETFEVVTILETIEHLRNPGKALSNIHEHLTEGGDLIVSSPNPFHCRFVWNNMSRSGSGHINYYHPRPFKFLAKKYGFERKEFFYIIENWRECGTFKGKIFLLLVSPLKHLKATNWVGVFELDD